MENQSDGLIFVYHGCCRSRNYQLIANNNEFNKTKTVKLVEGLHLILVNDPEQALEFTQFKKEDADN